MKSYEYHPSSVYSNGYIMMVHPMITDVYGRTSKENMEAKNYERTSKENIPQSVREPTN
jgi:hypothetical protein